MLGVWIPPEDEWTDHVAVMVQGEENAQVQKSCGKRMVVSALKLLHPGRNSTHVSIYYNGYLNVHNAYITNGEYPVEQCLHAQPLPNFMLLENSVVLLV